MPRLFRHLIWTTPAISLGIALCALSVATAAEGQTNGSPERFTATAINMNRGSAGIVEIAVNRWSTEKQHDQLMSVMFEQGPDKLLSTLQKMPRVGYIQVPGRLGWDVHFARRVPLPDGGERVVLLTDRRISFFEEANQTRSVDYPFTFIELRLNGDGEGDGKISLATKIIADKENNIVTLENYELQPVTLTNVKRERAHQ